jgi:hypothetical protein
MATDEKPEDESFEESDASESRLLGSINADNETILITTLPTQPSKELEDTKRPSEPTEF